MTKDAQYSETSISRIVQQIAPEMVHVSHEIHAHPELGGEERFACELLTSILRREGFEVNCPVAGLDTAFIGRKRLGLNNKTRSGPRIAFAAEYDALPRLGHGCGHNWIAASSLGASLALARAAAELDGEVLLIGTPAEESFGGKVTMCDAGIFDDLDAVMMIHPSHRTQVARTSLASCPIEVEFQGKRAHAAASPQEGVNALDAMMLLFHALDQLKRGLRDSARLPGIIIQGGEAPNVIPDCAVARFTLRADTSSYVEYILQRVKECAKGAAIATRCSFSTQRYEPGYLELRSNLTLVEIFRNQLRELEQEEHQGSVMGMGSLDIGNVSHVVPTICPDLTIALPEVGGHTEAFRDAAISQKADEMLAIAALALAGTGIELLRDPALVEMAHKEQKGSL